MGGLDTSRVADSGVTNTAGNLAASTRLALEGHTKPGAVQRTEQTGPAAFDPVTSADSVHAMSENVFHMKDAAEQSLTQGWPAASKNYDATIAQANTNQQLDIPNALKAVDALLATTTDDATKRTLLQEKLDLETIEKAPGFTLAVKAFAEKRLGMDDDSARDLAAAKQLWSQLSPPLNMEEDPNFQKHLANVTAQEAQLKAQPTGTAGSPAETARVSPEVLPQAKTIDDATITRLNLPNDWNRESGVQQATWLLSQTQPLNDDTKALYENAIAKAGAGPSPAIPALTTDIQTRQAHLKLDQAKIPDYDNKLGQILTGLTADIATLPADKQNIANALVTSYRAAAVSKADQDGARQQIAKLDPTIGPKINQSLDALDALNQPIQPQLFALHQDFTNLTNEQNELTIARASYAQALSNAGDTQGAQTQIVKAIGDNLNPAQALVFKKMATDYGVPADQVNKMPDVASTAATTTTGNLDTLPGIAAALAQANQGLAAETGDKKAALEKHQAEFETAIHAADAYMTAHGPELVKDMDDATTQIQAKMTPDEIVQLQVTAAKLQAESKRVQQASPADLALYAKYKDQTTTDADRQTALAQLTKTQPTLVQLDHDFLALYGKAPDAIDMKLHAVSLMQSATALRFVSHETYATVLNAAGRPDLAVPQLREAFKDLPPNMRQSYSQDPKIKPLVDALKFDMNTVPAPELPFFLKAAQAVPSQAPDVSTLAGAQPRDTQVAPGGTDGNTAAVAKMLEQGEADRKKLEQLETSAQQTLKDHGLAAAKPLFDQAVKLADQLAGDPNENKTNLAKGLAILTDTAHPMQPEQRTALLAMLRQTVTLQENAADIHRVYANAYNSGYQWGDAQREYQEADKRFATIDNALVGQFIGVLNTESKRQDIDPQLAAQYASDSTNISKAQDQQVALHLTEASFYLVGGRKSDGTPVNWDTGLQKPVIPGDPPLKPDAANAALVRAAQLDKELHPPNGSGADFAQRYVLLASTLNANAPANLQIAIQSVKSQYQKPVSQIMAAGAGLAATFILGAISEGRLARLGAGGDDAAIRAIRAGEAGGFLTKAADFFAADSKVARISSAAVLSPVGRFAVGAGTAGTVNTLEQYYGLQNHEAGSRKSAFVEGAGAFTAAMALIGTRNYMGQRLFSGFTSETLGNQAIRILEADGGAATKEALAKRFSSNGYAVPDVLKGTGPLTSDIASQAFNSGSSGAMLMGKLFTKAERGVAAAAAPDVVSVKGGTINPITSDLARRNMIQNYSALTAFSLVNTMTASGAEAISINDSQVDGDARSWKDPWVSWNPLRPINNLDGSARGTFTDYAVQAMTSPLIGNLFFAELGSLPAASALHTNLGGSFSAARAEALALKAGTTTADASAAQSRVARLWSKSSIVRPVYSEVTNQMTRFGSYWNPTGNFSEMTVAEKVRQASYLPVLANGGALQLAVMGQAALPWGPIGGMRAEWERELASENYDIQNDMTHVPVAPKAVPPHPDVVAPGAKGPAPKPTGAAVIQAPGGNGMQTNGL